MRRFMARSTRLRTLPTGLVLGGAGAVVLMVLRLVRGPLPVFEWLLIAGLLAERLLTECRQRRQRHARRVRERAARCAPDDECGFVAAIAHDLQQPLYALRLATDALALQAPPGQRAEALGQMRSALVAADGLVTALIGAAGLAHSDPLPHPQTFPVQPLLERVEALFAAQARHKRLSWRVPPSAAWVHTDAALLERMLGNLVSNAMRYTDRGGVLLACRERGGTLLIQVWDTGRGITAGEADAVFRSYRRGSAAQPGDEGMGLGLSIVARCARRLRIGVSLRSVPGRGTRFELRVPRGTAPPSA